MVQYLCMKGIDVHATSYVRCPLIERLMTFCYDRYPNEPFYCKQDNKTAYQLAKDKHKHLCVQFLKSWYDTSQVRYQNSMASLGCDASLTATYCRIEICPCR